MAHRRFRDRVIVPLLALLSISASAAASTPEQAARDARVAIDGTQLDRGDPAKAVKHLLTLAYAAIRLDDAKEATRRLEEAKAIAAANQPQMLPEIYCAFILVAPNLAKAEELAAKTTREAKRYGDRRSEMRAMAALQYRYGGAQRFTEAIYWGEKALELAQSLRDEKSISQIEGNLGWSYIELGDYETADELITSANKTAARLGLKSDQVPWLIQLGNLRAMRGDRASADRFFREAAMHARSTQHAQLGFALANLAILAVDEGRFADARRFNAEAIEVKRRAKDREAALRSLIIGARIDAGTGNVDEAARTLKRVSAATKRAATRWEAHGRLGEVFANANRTALADEQFRLAIETVSAARRSIKDRDLSLSFFNTTSDIFAAYLDFLIEQERLAGALETTERIRTDALDETLEVHARRIFPDPRAIARQQNATILSYWLGPRRSYVWKITAAEVRAAVIAPEKTIRDAVDTYRRSLLGADGTLKSTGARGERLYKLLGIPNDLAPGSRVIVIPDGDLHALNFETLVVPSPKPHYWIEDVNIVAASSVQLLARREKAPNRAPRMLLIGNPLEADPAFPRLPHAGREIELISRRFPARLKVIDGAAATPAAYRNASPQTFDFIHFVAHGIATRRRPLESAVILGEDATKNYRLLARDILKQPLRARLVTISSCHGAGTRAYTGEGLVGLAWAFLRAGSSNVIAALWEVNDVATPRLMDDVYREIAAGRDPAMALREAKLKFVRSNSAYRKPRYWAPFVLYAGR